MFKGVVSLVVAFALVAVVGCGGGSDSSSLTKAEFSKQGNKICAEATQARSKIVGEAVKNADPKANQEDLQVELIEKIVPTYESAAEKIGDLGAPKGEEEKVENLVGEMEDAADRVMADPHTAAISNVPFRKADKVAQELGLKECVV